MMHGTMSLKFDLEYIYRNFIYGFTFLIGLVFVTKFIFIEIRQQ